MGKAYNNVKVNESGFYTEYTGNGDRLQSLGLQLLGLDEGLKRVIQWQKA